MPFTQGRQILSYNQDKAAVGETPLAVFKQWVHLQETTGCQLALECLLQELEIEI